MGKNKQKYKVKKLFNGREYELTQEQYDLWIKGKIKFTLIQSPIKAEDVPDVLKEVH